MSNLRTNDPQPLPTPGDGRSVTDAVIAELERRRQLGITKYRKDLESFNGRDPLRDLLDELLDGAQYAVQAIMERGARRSEAAAKPDPDWSPSKAFFFVATLIRDAVNRYRDSSLAKDEEELSRLVELFNLPEERIVEAVQREYEWQKKGVASA